MTKLNLAGLSETEIQKIHHWSVVTAMCHAIADQKPDSTEAEELAQRALARKLRESDTDAIEWFYYETYSAIHAGVLHPAKQ
jgi:hypothetical protein